MNSASTLLPRKFASIDALTRADLVALLDAATTLRRCHAVGAQQRPLKGTNLAVVVGDGAHEHAATFAHAARDLGARVAEIDGRRQDETPEASARLLGRLYDAIDCEGLDAHSVRAIEREAGVPVFDGLAADAHPAQVVASLMELADRAGKPLEALKLAVAGDANTRFARALLKAATLAGVDVRSDGRPQDIDLVVDPRRRPSHDLHRYGVQAVLLAGLR